MKEATRPYRQGARAVAAQERTDRIMTAAMELFVERPFDQITLPGVADRAGVGLQTLIRRVGTKDGLVAAVAEWVAPQIRADRGEPTSDDPDAVATVIARHYSRWAAVTDRTISQSESSPALAANAAGGRRAHREWVAAAFATPLAALPPDRRRRLLASLVGVCGVELWLVLTRDGELSTEEARDAVADLIAGCLAGPRTTAGPVGVRAQTPARTTVEAVGVRAQPPARPRTTVETVAVRAQPPASA